MKSLYKIDRKGKTRVWKVKVWGDRYEVSSGIILMRMVITETLCKPKNIGKKNETSANEQAIKEAAALWKRQIERNGYREDLNQEQEFSVQLASNYTKTPDKCKKNATEKMWYQYKLDGLKGYYKDGKMNSRRGVIYDRVSLELLSELEEMSNILKDKYGMINPVIDGELFIDNRFWLEDLNSIVRGGDLVSGFDKGGIEFIDVGPDNVKLHICNIYDESIKAWDYEDVIPIIEDFDMFSYRIKICYSHLFDFKSLELYLDDADERRDEGIIIYMNSPYCSGKHAGVWKVKRMDDSEWRIIGYKESKTVKVDGVTIKQFQHTCQTTDGDEFDVRMKGSHYHREEIGSGKDIGKLLKIQYQGLYKTGKPVFPVGLATRLEEDINEVN